MRKLIFLFILPLVSACSLQLEQLKSTAMPEDGFNAALASEYMAYSQSEYEQGHFIASNHFAGKGLEAANGTPPEPDSVTVSAPASQPLNVARAGLMQALTPDVKSISAQKAARAQLLFDCWQNQLADKKENELAPCGDEFASIISELQNSAELFTGKDTLSTNYRIGFAPSSKQLDADGKAKIRAIAKKAKKAADYSLQLDGHVGGLDKKPQTEALAKGRLEAVRKSLLAAGLLESRIRFIHEDAGAAPVVLSSEPAPPVRSVDITLATLSIVKK